MKNLKNEFMYYFWRWIRARSTEILTTLRMFVWWAIMMATLIILESILQDVNYLTIPIMGTVLFIVGAVSLLILLTVQDMVDDRFYPFAKKQVSKWSDIRYPREKP